MGDVINLNRARKARRRAEKATEAEANRALHGRTRAEKQAAKAEQARVSARWTARGARVQSPSAVAIQ